MKVILPNALPGILTGAILALARAAGETAAVMYTGTVFFFFDFDMPSVPKSITTTASAMMDMMYMLSTPMFAPSAP